MKSALMVITPEGAATWDDVITHRITDAHLRYGGFSVTYFFNNF
ncbi:MAG: hypothetical protein RL094_399 [Candidatus Parcubacteria bacterium]|jgi:hypothetical protein